MSNKQVCILDLEELDEKYSPVIGDVLILLQLKNGKLPDVAIHNYIVTIVTGFHDYGKHVVLSGVSAEDNKTITSSRLDIESLMKSKDLSVRFFGNVIEVYCGIEFTVNRS